MNALTQNTKITASDINTLISELNGKLNLSGGVMTGRINLKDTNLALGEVTEHTWHNSPIQFYDKNNKRHKIKLEFRSEDEVEKYEEERTEEMVGF